jgi:hypothetical protein
MQAYRIAEIALSSNPAAAKSTQRLSPNSHNGASFARNIAVGGFAENSG